MMLYSAMSRNATVLWCHTGGLCNQGNEQQAQRMVRLAGGVWRGSISDFTFMQNSQAFAREEYRKLDDITRTFSDCREQGATAFPQQSHVAGKKKKRKSMSWRERFKHEVGKLVAEISAADELITNFWRRFWRRWMPLLAIRIHTSLIHPAPSHCGDPVTCSESPPSPPCSAASLPPPLFVLRLSSSRTGRQISCIVAQTRRENVGKYI